MDRAWELFLESKSSLTKGAGKHAFADWLWDELGQKRGTSTGTRRER